ncbi:MAG: DUF6883 domain-containing protein [Pirellulaceae bacterium]
MSLCPTLQHPPKSCLAIRHFLQTVSLPCDRFDTQRSPHGVKYKAAGMISRPNHRPGRVLTVWIVEDDGPPRLVTAYPDDSQ